MPATPAAQRLRQRAATLRALANRLQRLRSLTLHLAAGPDTWVGPSPQRCGDALQATRRSLLHHGDVLVSEARRLDRVADQIDIDAATLPGVR